MTTRNSTTPPPGSAQSFRDWSHAKSLTETLARAEAGVRAKPQDPQARWLLFELLCVLGQWDRALKQLQTWAELSKEFDSTAHVMRGLIRAEHQRMEVFAGSTAPATIAAADSQAEAWMTGLGDALVLARDGAQGVEASDASREAALAQVPEVVLLGAYRWLAFADLRSLSKAAPARLLDLVWSQVDLVLRDGTPLKAYMPMRYPVSANAQAHERDALLMARETVWSELGRTGVHARGQKMWMTDAGDMALLDLRECHFGESTAAFAGDV
jgi:type VI secretion system protein ImpE